MMSVRILNDRSKQAYSIVNFMDYLWTEMRYTTKNNMKRCWTILKEKQGEIIEL